MELKEKTTPHSPILRRQKNILRNHGAKGGSGSRARDGRSLQRE